MVEPGPAPNHTILTLTATAVARRGGAGPSQGCQAPGFLGDVTRPTFSLVLPPHCQSCQMLQTLAQHTYELLLSWNCKEA